MDDVRNVLAWNNTLVDAIKEYTGDYSPTGLHSAINIIQDKISNFYLKKLRWIAAIRNKIVHENLDIPEDYFDACQEAYTYLCDCFSRSKNNYNNQDINYNNSSGIKSEHSTEIKTNKKSKKSWAILIITTASLLYIMSSFLSIIPVSYNWNPTISFERDDDLFSKDDYFVNIEFQNNSRETYDGIMKISILTNGISIVKEKDLELDAGKSELFKIPIEYSFVNQENADNQFLAGLFEGSTVTLTTANSNQFLYIIKNGKLEILRSQE